VLWPLQRHSNICMVQVHALRCNGMSLRQGTRHTAGRLPFLHCTLHSTGPACSVAPGSRLKTPHPPGAPPPPPADDPRPLVPGGEPCLRLQVSGSSFLLHHIRHMIGGAIATALGLMTLDFLRASLSLPARLSVPRAPPHSLLLLDCSFFDFPNQAAPGEMSAAEWVPALRCAELACSAGVICVWRPC
jgi:hypothetical protein